MSKERLIELIRALDISEVTKFELNYRNSDVSETYTRSIIFENGWRLI